MLRKGSFYLNSEVYYNFSVRFHQAIIEDFFGLTLNQLKSRGFYFIGWGFSYQAFDTKSNRPLCDFKFDSSSINHGEMFGTEPGLETIEHGPRQLQGWIKTIRFCGTKFKHAIYTWPLIWYLELRLSRVPSRNFRNDFLLQNSKNWQTSSDLV